MNRRNFFKSSILGLTFIHFRILNGITLSQGDQTATNNILTVKGIISKREMGFTLVHEHLLVDFIGADQYNPEKWDRDEVEDIMIPYLLEIKDLGCRTFIDCTPE